MTAVIVKGTVGSNSIVLEQPLDMPDGQLVEITVRPIQATGPSPDTLGVSPTEGALRDDPWWDGIMDDVHAARRHDRARECDAG